MKSKHATIKVDKNKCTSCGYCVLVCPTEAFDNEIGLHLIEEKCTGCGECVPYCYCSALSLEVNNG